MKKAMASFPLFLLAIGSLFLLTQCQSEEDILPDDTNNEEETNGNGHNHGTECDQDLNAYPLEDLSAEETNTLLFMREEEKLARDVYLQFYDDFGLTPFSHISSSEQRHMDRIFELIERYDLTDPVGANDPGVFSDSELQQLYENLIATGSIGEIEALKVGGAIEEIDILDLREALSMTDNQDLDAVFTCLMNGSYNHLRAFVKNLKNRDVIYIPQYLSQADYDAILNP